MARGRLGPFSSCFESQALSAVVRERRVYTHTHTQQIELKFVKLGAAYYGMCRARRIIIIIIDLFPLLRHNDVRGAKVRVIWNVAHNGQSK